MIVRDWSVVNRSDATAGHSSAHHDAGKNLAWPLIVDEVKTFSQWAKSLEEDAKKDNQVKPELQIIFDASAIIH